MLNESSTIDEFHNWYDVLAGAVIGTIMAFSGYRMVYASVWDFRFNHIPLTRHYPYTFEAGGPGANLHGAAIWARQAGWVQDARIFGGAPFDAADGMGLDVVSSVGKQGGGHHGIPCRPIAGHSSDNIVWFA